MPRLKNRAWTENRGVSGISRTAKGSSNDSSISCRVKEPSTLKGGLFQSNSIFGFHCRLKAHSKYIQCIYARHSTLSTEKMMKNEKKQPPGGPVTMTNHGKGVDGLFAGLVLLADLVNAVHKGDQGEE